MNALVPFKHSCYLDTLSRRTSSDPLRLDLRWPEVQEWFCRFFGDIHSYPGGELDKGAKPGSMPSTLMASMHDAPSSFFDMLPVLMDPAIGGNAITDQIGQVLRKKNVSALIYPSARNAAGVGWRDHSVQRFRGWNLVDYRGAGFQFMDGLTIFLGANPWNSNSAKYFQFEKLDDEGSWLMAPPKRELRKEAVTTSDEDLQVRYEAGKPVLARLLEIAFTIKMNNNLEWLDAMATACALPNDVAWAQKQTCRTVG